MNIFSKKAAEVRKQGALERGEFQPKGTPKEMYKYWLATQKNPPAQDNFCHFWRVVVIWAPLAYLRAGLRNLGKALAQPASLVVVGLVVLAALVVLGILVDAVFIAGPAIAAGTLYALLGLLAAAVAHKEFNGLEDMYSDEDETKNVFKWTLPVSWPLYQIIGLLKKVPEGVYMWSAVVLLGVAGLAAAGLVISFLIMLAMDVGWALLWWSLGIAGVLGAFIGLLFVVFTIVDYYKARKFQKQLEYEEKVANGEITPPLVVEVDPWVPGPVLSKVIGFLVGVKDFAVLGFNVLRVNKWKICPLVKID